VQIRCLPWAEAGPAAAETWTALRASNPVLRSPFFSWEFTRAVAARQPHVELAVVEDARGVAGYLPFQRVGPRRAEPVGTPLNDYQGLIARPGLAFDPLRLLDACALERFDYDHVVAEQPAWAPYHRQRAFSPFLDLSAGFEAWARDRRRVGRSRFERLKELRRALGRAAGPLRFEYDVRDERVLEALLSLKSDQYRRTLGAERDLFANPVMAGIVRDIFAARSPELAGVLSALWAGDRLVAAHFGMRSGPVLHWWFPAFSTELARYSPGALLLLHLAEGSAAEGVSLVDFGKGDESYKLRWANGRFEVAEGYVDRGEARAVRAYLDQELADARLRRSVIALQRELARLDAMETPRTESAPAAADTAAEARALRDAHHDLQSLRASSSWRLTGPLRAAGDAWRRRRGPAGNPGGVSGEEAPAPSLEAQLRRTRADVEAIRRSLSWRLAGPLRAVSRLVGFPYRS
jgi:CelD/BcsL family acetyltransferase involved in cellulose biosynthesis